jgi:hypothetical protein
MTFADLNNAPTDSAVEYVNSREFPVSVLEILARRLAGRVSETEAALLAADIAEDVADYVGSGYAL